MPSTRLAKIFLFVNVALSLGLAAWALGVYTNRVEWGNKPGTADQPPGELVKRTEAIKRLQEGRNLAETRWASALASLRTLEKRRNDNQAWYAARLRDIEGGQQPVPVLVYVKGRLPVTNQGLPVMQVPADPNAQLPSFAVMSKRFQQLQSDTAAEIRSLDNLVNEEKQLTLQINGDGQNLKGLRPQLADEERARRDALGEQQYLEPLVLNRQVEAQILQKRQHSLEARLKELGEGVASRKP